MALATVLYAKGRLSEKHLVPLSKHLSRWIAEQLNCDDEGGSLKTDEVTVFFRENGPHDVTNGVEVLVHIVTDETPTRLAEGPRILSSIMNKVARTIPLGLVVAVYAGKIGYVDNKPVASS